MEVPKKKFKQSILDFFSKDVPCFDEAPTPSSCSLVIEPPFSPESNTSLPSHDNENSDCEPTVMGLPSSSAESIFDDHGTPSESSCAQQSIPLPVLGTCDVGSLKVSLNLCRLSDDDKYNILTHLDRPQNFNFPAVREGQQLRRFKSSWFIKYNWFTYSRSENGGYCAYCLLFPSSTKRGGRFGALVEAPLQKFKKALEILAQHEETEYHKDSYCKTTGFLERMVHRCVSINAQLNTLHAAQMERNRAILKSIITCVEFCGRQGIPLRGHRDDANDLQSDGNHGNFQALLKFRCESGDTVLDDHFKNCAKMASYRSKTIQNDIIEVLGSMITEKIVQEVAEAKFLSIICDEVQDVASIEQITFILRYVHKEGDCYVIKESFILKNNIGR